MCSFILFNTLIFMTMIITHAHYFIIKYCLIVNHVHVFNYSVYVGATTSMSMVQYSESNNMLNKLLNH